MKAKTFIHNLSQCIFEEYKDEIPKEDLKSSFVQAIKNISAGKLQDELNNNFDKNLKRLEKSLKDLCTRELPSISGHVDDSLEELTKSELDGRTDIAEEEGTKQHVHKVVYNLVDRQPKKPKLSAVKKLDDKKRYLVYRTFLQKVLNREDVTDTFIRTVIQDFDDLCEISKNEEDGKSKFDWLPMCSLLLELTTGSMPLAFIRVLKVLFESIQNDVDKCLAKGKPLRSGKLANIIKKFITSSHLKVEKDKLKESEEKMYCRYVSALLSFFIDLCCVHSSQVVQKKLYGREIAGYVCYILQQWPESVLEVALQIQGSEDDYYNILLPLIIKCLEVKPSGTDHVYYLKYVMLVRQVKDAYGEHEEIQAWNLATKNIPARTGFLDWLSEECPEAMEYIPVEDKKFKSTKITRFLLEEAEDDLITILLNSLSKEDEGKTDDVPVTEEDAEDTGVTMATDNLFYLDKAGGSSSILELADGQVTEEPNTKISSQKKRRKGSTKELSTKLKPIVLKTVEDVEKLVDTKVLEDGINSPQTYTLDPKFVMEKVKDPEDQKFLQSEIISITSVSSLSEGEETIGGEVSEDTIKDNDSKVSNSSDKSARWTKSNSSTPNKERKRHKIGKNGRKHETDDSDISAIEKTEDFCDSVTSASEDDHKVKSVVRKVTPRKTKAKSMKSPEKDEDMSDSTVKIKQNIKAEKGLLETVSASNTKGIDKGSRDEIDFSETVISITDSDNELETKDDSTSQLSKGADKDNAIESTNEDEELSSVHESSVEIVDIILEPDENSNASNLEEKATVSEEKINKDRSDQNRLALSKVSSPKKLQKTGSPRKQLLKKSPVPINTRKAEESVMSETSLSCMSGLSTLTNYSETVEITTSDISEMDQNSTVEGAELDNTAKYIGGECKESSYKAASESGSDTFKDKSKKASKKSLSGEKKDVISSIAGKDDTGERVGKSPKKSQSKVSKMHAEEECDEDVFQQTPEKKNKTQAMNTRSIEEKFIEKAIKGKKTPKKSNVVKEVSGSVSLFTDAENIESEGEGAADEDPGKRTKSTEEIFEIVEEIKEKIRTPSTRKSVSKGKEKLNESMFTDDSVESLENELEVSSKELKSPEKKRKLKSDSSDKSSPRKMKLNEKERKKSLGDVASDVRNTDVVKSPVKYAPKVKTPSKVGNTENSGKQSGVEIIDLNGDENNEQKISEDKIQENSVSNANTSGNTAPSEKLNISPRKGGKKQSKTSECLESVSNTPSPKKSPLKMKEKITPHKTASDDEAGKLRSPVEAVQSGSETEAKPSLEVSENSDSGSKTRISVPGTPDKKSVTPIKSAVGNTNKNNKKSPESENVSKKKADTIDIVSDSDTESDISGKKDLSPKEKIDKEHNVEFKTKNKTPQSAKRNISERKENVKTPEGKTDTNTTPKSGTKKSPETPGNTSLVKTPKSGKKKKLTPAKSESAAKNKSPAMKHTQETNQSDSGEDFVPSSQKKSRTVSDIKVSKKKETGVPTSGIESDEDLSMIPDIGAHLKPESTKSSAVESKSPCIPSSSDSKTLQKKKNESTPQKGQRQSQRIKDSPDQSTEPVKDASTKKRVARSRGMSELIDDSEKESDIDGPARPKRLRSATKTVPETAKSVATKEKAVKSKTDLKKIYDWNSETDATTDQSDVETRRSRRSKGGNRFPAVKDKIPAPVEEEPGNLLSTPPGKLARQRKGSASTTKKNVKNVDNLRGTRKRPLSGELAVESSAGNNSTDSEVSFPKKKPVVGADKKSKRLSTPVVHTPKKESETDASGRRYSLRKK
ncbi:serine/arginine repetitive matrix protein 2-like [Mercenaria mercenaria]|uniref:serine/arginine repetitive matrix protein 2-like n=1 Tax=Mercenaria mercenaria TaxID=6596 RepID=UPI00234E5717|nr:serine/arginine repetitive matrix protein 2-like [Mercenaria mercenaria]